jgi:hypothetical protein
MAYQSFWYKTHLPEEMVDIIVRDLKNNNIENLLEESTLVGGHINHKQRKSKNSWIYSSYWLAGYIWFYIDRINEENFRYDLTGIDNDAIQYTQYGEGEFYNWHVDSSFKDLYEFSSTKASSASESMQEIKSKEFLKANTESVRKLSFTVQLSDPDSYEGGDVQMMDDSNLLYTVPRERGTIVVFDSRTKHRVRKVTKGVRRSLVGWCVGPRWR